MTPDEIAQCALKAGAAKFYPERQSAKGDNYLVGQGFLEKFAAEVLAFNQSPSPGPAPARTS